MSVSLSRSIALLTLISATYAQNIIVAAASDLSTLQEPLAQLFRAKAGVEVRFTFGSSGVLARQIENGAPFDVFLSANRMYVAELARSGRLEAGTVRVYALGRLGLWSRDGRIREVEQLRSAGVKHVALPNPQHAPYGVAAVELLRREGLWAALESKVVYGENVRQALQFADSGNADAAITAWSLVVDRGGVELPPEHAPIEQAGGVVAGTRYEGRARAVLDA